MIQRGPGISGSASRTGSSDGNARLAKRRIAGNAVTRGAELRERGYGATTLGAPVGTPARGVASGVPEHDDSPGGGRGRSRGSLMNRRMRSRCPTSGHRGLTLEPAVARCHPERRVLTNHFPRAHLSFERVDRCGGLGIPPILPTVPRIIFRNNGLHELLGRI